MWRAVGFGLAMIASAAAFSCSWWMKYRTTESRLNPQWYSRASASGVMPALYGGLGDVAGARRISTGYAPYLSAVAKEIGFGTSRAAPFNEVGGPDWIEGIGKQRSKVAFAPIVNDAFLFGVQRQTRFRLRHGTQSDAKLTGRWAWLSTVGGQKILAPVLAAGAEEIVIGGSLPLDFFPSEIELVLEPDRRRQKAATFVAVTSLGPNMRGGVVNGFAGTTLFVYRPSWARGRFILPTAGDTLAFANGEKMVVQAATGMAWGFLVTLDKAPDPYFTTRTDMIAIRPGTVTEADTPVLQVDPVSDDVFLNGRERHLRIFAPDLPASAVGGFIGIDSSTAAYFVSSAAEEAVGIDLLTSLAAQICLSQLASGTAGASKAAGSSGSPSFGRLTPADCLDAKGAQVRSIETDLSQWNRLADGTRVDIERRLDAVSQLTAEEVWYRGLAVDIVRPESVVSPAEATARANARTWEVYPGSMVNLLQGRLNPAPRELLIHVLSDEDRRRYYAAFEAERAPYFVLAKPRQFTPWLIDWHWPLFRSVLRSYEPVWDSLDFTIWKRADTVEDGGRDWSDAGRTFPLVLAAPSPAGGCAYALHEVTVTYEIKNPLQRLPLIGTSTRLLIDVKNIGTDLPAANPISLPPRPGSYTFPVFARTDASPQLTLRQLGPIASLVEVTVTGVKTRVLDIPQGRLSAMFLENEGLREIAKYGCRGHDRQ